MQIDYPYHIARNGRTAQTDTNDHIRDMIEQVLFTQPGERVNRPTFGCGLLGGRRRGMAASEVPRDALHQVASTAPQSRDHSAMYSRCGSGGVLNRPRPAGEFDAGGAKS